MPYPHSQRPTFAEFKHRLTTEFGCRFETIEAPLIINGQKTILVMPRFVRELAGKQLRATIHLKDDEIVEYSLIRSICRLLEVPPAAFGLDLDPSWYEADEDVDESDAVN